MGWWGYAKRQEFGKSSGSSPSGRPWTPRGRLVRWLGFLGFRLVGTRGRLVGALCAGWDFQVFARWAPVGVSCAGWRFDCMT